MSGKSFLVSKTFWVNIIALLVMLVQTQTGFIIDVEEQAVILGVINLILRFITKGPVGWKSEDSQSGFANLGLVILLFALVGFMCQFQGCTKNLQLEDPRSMSVQDVRLIATTTYNNMYDYHVMKSGMAGLTQQEKDALNDVKKALQAIRDPLREFQLLVDRDMNPSPELRNKIILFLDHWMYKQLSQ